MKYSAIIEGIEDNSVIGKYIYRTSTGYNVNSGKPTTDEYNKYNDITKYITNYTDNNCPLSLMTGAVTVLTNDGLLAVKYYGNIYIYDILHSNEEFKFDNILNIPNTADIDNIIKTMSTNEYSFSCGIKINKDNTIAYQPYNIYKLNTDIYYSINLPLYVDNNNYKMNNSEYVMFNINNELNGYNDTLETGITKLSLPIKPYYIFNFDTDISNISISDTNINKIDIDTNTFVLSINDSININSYIVITLKYNNTNNKPTVMRLI